MMLHITTPAAAIHGNIQPPALMKSSVLAKGASRVSSTLGLQAFGQQPSGLLIKYLHDGA